MYISFDTHSTSYVSFQIHMSLLYVSFCIHMSLLYVSFDMHSTSSHREGTCILFHVSPFIFICLFYTSLFVFTCLFCTSLLTCILHHHTVKGRAFSFIFHTFAFRFVCLFQMSVICFTSSSYKWPSFPFSLFTRPLTIHISLFIFTCLFYSSLLNLNVAIIRLF